MGPPRPPGGESPGSTTGGGHPAPGWREVPDVGHADPRRRVPPAWRRPLGPAAVAVALGVLGATTLAVAAAAAAGLLLVVGVLRPRWAERVDVALVGFGRLVGTTLSAVLLGAFHLVVLLPVAVVLRLLAHDPLVPRWTRHEGTAWRRRSPASVAVHDAPWAVEVGVRQDVGGASSPSLRRGLLRAVPAVLGWLVLLVALDLGVGWAWRQVREDPDGAGPSAAVLATVHPERADLPAMAGDPWAEDYFGELARIEHEFEPYVQWSAEPFDGRFINVLEDGTRASYRPEGDDLPTVWFFGGSTTWGEGQRDGHTVPSEVARLAEVEGAPLEVVNFAERGYVLWQEALLFDQELARRPAPDLVVFYDGSNELNVQREQDASGDMSFYGADDLERALDGDGGSDLTVRQQVVRSSLTAQLLEHLGDPFGIDSAGAQPVGEDPPPEGLNEAAAGAYRRARAVALHRAEAASVPVRFFWQPERVTGPGMPITETAALVGAPTVDLSGVLDDLDPDTIYIDGGHTNELGAALVAAAMWPHLAAALEDGASQGTPS